ncbi:MAG: aldo/keto reductase [Pseudomonadales bacterium]|nr:aldo/keto reductase [Pseudomonadales bacterium]
MDSNSIFKLGYGCWQLGGPNQVQGQQTGWGAFDAAEAERAIHCALDHGVNFFDTADSYGRGNSERFLGKVLSKVGRQDLFICSKFGNKIDANGAATKDYSADWLLEAVHGSLRRLQVERIDVLLLHSPPDDFAWAEYSCKALEQLQSAGKIGSYGVSSKSVYGARAALQAGFGSAYEVIYNVLDRRAEEQVCPYLAADQLMIARVPLASGFLSPRLLKSAPVFAEDDYRRYQSSTINDWLLGSARKLSFLNDLEGGIAVSALRFCLFNSLVGVVIPGMRTEIQVRTNLQAIELGPLSDAVLQEIEAAVPSVPDAWIPSQDKL